MLQALINKKLSTVDIKQLSSSLGYRSTDKFKQRLSVMIGSAYLGLDRSYYDFYLSSEEFVRQLCDSLAIPKVLVANSITEIKVELEKKKYASKQFIFIDTDFKRQSQPVFILAAMQQQRYLSIDDNIAIKPINHQLQAIQAKVRGHYKQFPVMEFWGQVQRYAYFYQPDIIIVLSRTGEIVEITTEYPLSMATLNL